MRWIKPNITGSFYSLFTPSGEGHESRLANRVEDIRLAMLDMLGDDGARCYPQVARRVRFAGDAQGLWYARGDLMAALAGMKGEAAARQKMISLNSMFDGLLPRGMVSRMTSIHG
jgi:hypothetical protein